MRELLGVANNAVHVCGMCVCVCVCVCVLSVVKDSPTFEANVKSCF